MISKGSEEYNSAFVYRTTIYPEYNYYDFIGNIMPVVEGENINYDFKPGVFTLALSKALGLLKYNIPVYLVIEEMSRGNIASVFGDIFQLLDRDENGRSEYTIDNDIITDFLSKEQIDEYQVESEDNIIKKGIYFPSNLNILGTINTSDQNVFVMDTAFKRRFEFEYVNLDPIRDEISGKYLNEYEFDLEDENYSWNNLYKHLNNYIVIELELQEDKQIGQFFIKFNKKSNEENYKQLQNKLLPYLWDDIHLIKMTEKSIFKERYKSFSKLYEDFGNKINIFSNKFIETLSIKETSNSVLEDVTKGNKTKYEEVRYD